MKIICPTCNTAYNMPERKIPQGKKLVATCKGCGNKFPVQASIPQAAQAGAVPESRSRIPKPQTMDPESAFSSTPDEESRSAPYLDYPELREMDPGKFKFNDIFVPNSNGGYRNRKNKYTLKILQAVYPRLEKVLQDGERVLKLAKGVAYYPVELILGNGYLTMMYNHYALAATDRRFLFININSRITKPTHYVFQLPYGNIKKVKRGLFGRGAVFYRHIGKRRIFNGVKAYHTRAIRELVEEKKGARPSEGNPAHAHENLCPSCFVPLDKGLTRCTACRVDFKDPKKAFLRSLFLPGLGDMYLGHRFLGAMELLFSLVVWLIVLGSLMAGETEGLIIALIILVFYNGIDALVTRHMANKGYMLAHPSSNPAATG